MVYSTRLIFNSVGNILRLGKAMVVAKEDFSLAKGKPKKIAWYK